MKIIITKTFRKDFSRIFVNKNFIEIFNVKLNQTHLIFLTKNLYKFKFFIKLISIRGVTFINIENYSIPILIIKKSDKKLGNNLILDKEIKEILDTKFTKMKKDLENGDYEIFS